MAVMPRAHIWSRLRALVSGNEAFISLIDQAIISGGNFASGLIAALTLSTSEFGLYVLATVIILEASGIQNALTLQPMMVNGAGLLDHQFRRYFTAQMLIQVGMVSVSTLVVLAIALAWEPLRPLAWPLAVASAAWQTQEFCRRTLYTRGAVLKAAVNNFISYDLQAAVLVLLYVSGDMSIELTLWVIAATSLLGVAVGLWQMRGYLSRDRHSVIEVARESFRLGRWIASSYALSAASVGAYPALLAGLAGLAATAGLGVVKQVVGPLHLLTRPLENFYLPRAARALDQEGTAALTAVLWRATRFSVPLFVVYIMVVAIGGEWIIRLVYGDKYVEHADALRVFALSDLLWLPVIVLRLELAARRLQRYLLLVEAWSALVVYGLGLVLIIWVGLMGAAIANIVVNLGALVLTVAAVMRERNRVRDGELGRRHGLDRQATGEAVGSR
jgi:O-antigen/teichoic acid export membrane protein